MTVNVAILGLDRIGISTALALRAKETDIRCRGWDTDPERRKTADDSGAFQKVSKKVKDVVADADIIILVLAPDELRSAVNEFKQTLKTDAVMVNMSRLHALPARLVKEILAQDNNFVSLLPVLNPVLLQEPLEELADGRADLFTDSLVYISAPPSAEERVLDVAVDLAVLLGSMPVFADAHEVDGLIAANLMLPKMAACALMNAVSRQPSWREGGSIAGDELALTSEPLNDMNILSSAQSMHANRENNVRLLDDLVASLQSIKTGLQEENSKKLEALLNDSKKAREDWLEQRSRVGKHTASTSSVPTEKFALERFLDLGS